MAPFPSVKLFAVVGMHRCGTSIVSRTLNLLGAHLGPIEDLMPAKPDNPTGFWETLSVAQLHDDLFAHFGGRWDYPRVLPPSWESSPELEPFVERIRGIVESHFRAADVAVWKDPRGSMFLPLWRRVVPIEKIVVCTRRPEEVASSLAAREGLDAEHVAVLWLRYLTAAWLDEAPRIVVSFDEIYERPRELARRLSDLIGAPPPREQTLAEIRRFVDPALRHYHPLQGEAGPAMLLARAAHAVLLSNVRDVVDPFFRLLSNCWRVEGLVADKGDRPPDWSAVFGELEPSAVELSEALRHVRRESA